MKEIGNYQDYLESKLRIDYRCMNRHVFSSFKRRLSMSENPSILDIGTGTGLMIRRIISQEPSGTCTMTGIDKIAESCTAARVMIEKELHRRKYAVRTSGGSYVAQKNKARLLITISHGDFFDDSASFDLWKAPYHFITAHAFMDLVPLGKTIERIRSLLLPGGFFYSSINYDGVTTFLPAYEDDEFERSLLELYNGSMNRRGEDDEPTGGDRTGSKLYHELRSRAFTVLDFGPSDWVVFPKNGSYTTHERRFLQYLLQMVYLEGVRAGRPAGDKLDRWYAKRLSCIDSGRLALITHQTDILSRKE